VIPRGEIIAWNAWWNAWSLARRKSCMTWWWN